MEMTNIAKKPLESLFDYPTYAIRSPAAVDVRHQIPRRERHRGRRRRLIAAGQRQWEISSINPPSSSTTATDVCSTNDREIDPIAEVAARLYSTERKLGVITPRVSIGSGAMSLIKHAQKQNQNQN